MNKEGKTFKAALDMAIWMSECVNEGIAGMIHGPGVLDEKIEQAKVFAEQAMGAELDYEGEAMYDIFFTVAQSKDAIHNDPLRAVDYAAITAYLESRRTAFSNAVIKFRKYFQKEFDGYYNTTEAVDAAGQLTEVGRERLKSVKHLEAASRITDAHGSRGVFVPVYPLDEQLDIDENNRQKWEAALVNLLRQAAKDDVFFSMRYEHEGQPGASIFKDGKHPEFHEVSPETGGFYDYSTTSNVNTDAVKIDDRNAIAKMFITTTTVLKTYCQPRIGGREFKRERLAFDTMELPKMRQHEPTLILGVMLKQSPKMKAEQIAEMLKPHTATTGLHELKVDILRKMKEIYPQADETILSLFIFGHTQVTEPVSIRPGFREQILLDSLERYDWIAMERDLFADEVKKRTADGWEIAGEFEEVISRSGSFCVDHNVVLRKERVPYALRFGNMDHRPELETVGVLNKDGTPWQGEVKPAENRYGPVTVTIHTQPGEPFFVLLGRDPQAPDLLDQWAVDRNQMEMGNPKIAQAMDIAELMRQFKEKHPELGMSKNLYDEVMQKDVIYLVPRDKPYSEQEILKMAMIVTNAAILSGVELNIQNNTCFTHIGKQDQLGQQIGQVTAVANHFGKEILVIQYKDGKPVEAWGNGLHHLNALFNDTTVNEMETHGPGEYTDYELHDAIEIPGLNYEDPERKILIPDDGEEGFVDREADNDQD